MIKKLCDYFGTRLVKYNDKQDVLYTIRKWRPFLGHVYLHYFRRLEPDRQFLWGLSLPDRYNAAATPEGAEVIYLESLKPIKPKIQTMRKPFR